MTSRRLRILVLSASALLAFTAAAFAQPAARAPQLAEQVFKNIQVLKGIPVDEFMDTMGMFSAATGLNCAHCHAIDNGAGWEAYATETPLKQTARRMLRMMNAINKDSFGGRQVVTCWTCHRGSQSPSSTPPMDMVYGDPVLYPADILPAQSGGNVVPVDTVFQKYMDALGGAQRVAAITSYTAKGTSMLYGEVNNDQVEINGKAPNQISMLVHEQEGDLARVYDGRQAWVMLPLTVVGMYPLYGSALEGQKMDGQFFFPAGIKGALNNWKSSYPITLDGKDMNVVQGNGANGLVVTLYFDKQTGLLRRAIRYITSAMGRVPTQFDYSDYRAVNGVQMPFKFTYAWISGREDYTLTDIQANTNPPAAKFAKPVQRTK